MTRCRQAHSLVKAHRGTGPIGLKEISSTSNVALYTYTYSSRMRHVQPVQRLFCSAAKQPLNVDSRTISPLVQGGLGGSQTLHLCTSPLALGLPDSRYDSARCPALSAGTLRKVGDAAGSLNPCLSSQRAGQVFQKRCRLGAVYVGFVALTKLHTCSSIISFGSSWLANVIGSMRLKTFAKLVDIVDIAALG